MKLRKEYRLLGRLERAIYTFFDIGYCKNFNKKNYSFMTRLKRTIANFKDVPRCTCRIPAGCCIHEKEEMKV